MHAFLIISKDSEVSRKKAGELAESQNAQLVPLTLQKIADVRELQEITKLSVQKETAFFVENIHAATIDALNAFLKKLEEPGKNTYYILTATSEDKVLPTIVSRCQVIRMQSHSTNHRSRTEITEKSVGEQFQILDKIKKRDEAVVFLRDLIDELHAKLIESPTVKTSNQLEYAQHALTALEKNGNVTSQFTRMVVLWHK